tara:strand:- start:1456 stop:2823 length:1368 start_codon:yes stop_codon:yes gene_type:complete
MMPVTLSQLARWSDGSLIQGRPADTVGSISTDSRKLEPGQVFLALKGDRFNAHDFLGEVGASGVSAMVVSELNRDTESYEGGVVRVADSLKALQRIAFHHRRNSPGLYAIGVTGSNGKTSTKDFLTASLSAAGRVCGTAGNLNNHIGLPLTILSGNGEEHFGVWEMGMNHPGEIEVLAEIAQPDAAVITHIGTAHIEHMGSREAIAAEKCELALAVPSSGFCAMPAGDDFYGYVAERVSCEMVSAGIDTGDVRAEGLNTETAGMTRFRLCSDFDGPPEVCLPVKGRHMVVNALLAAAVALRQGISPDKIAERLSAAELSGGRLQERAVGGFDFLDDSYNANPDSMLAAIETLRDSNVAGRRVAVLGFMGELGEHEEPAHLKLGSALSENGIDVLVTVGDRASRINEGAEGVGQSHQFDSHEEAADFLKGFLNGDDLVLVKGSRAAGMEKVIENLK